MGALFLPLGLRRSNVDADDLVSGQPYPDDGDLRMQRKVQRTLRRSNVPLQLPSNGLFRHKLTSALGNSSATSIDQIPG